MKIFIYWSKISFIIKVDVYFKFLLLSKIIWRSIRKSVMKFLVFLKV